MRQLPPKLVEDLTGGVVSYADNDVLPENVSPHAINVNFDLLGDVTQRNGTTLLGPQVSAGQAIQGIGQFISNDATRNRLVAAFGGINYAYDGTSWTNIGGGMTGAGVRYAAFLNYLYRAGGGTAVVSWDGVLADGFANYNAVGAPTGKYIVPYQQRLYVAGDPTYPTRLWFSTIASFAGAITWDTSSASTQYIDFTPIRANDVITGLEKVSDLLLIFLSNGMYTYNGSQSFAKYIGNIGCSSQESVASCKGLVFFFNPTGIYMTQGGYPQEISRPVYDWIKNMASSSFSSVSGFCDEDHYYCNIGTVTFSSPSKYRRASSYSNTWLVFTISSQLWTIYSLGPNFKAFTAYTTTANALTYVGGDDSGNVQTVFSGTTDNGSPIFWEYDTRPYEWDSSSTTKTVKDMGVTVINGLGTNVAVSEDGNPFRTVGEITSLNSILTSINARGKTMQFKFFGSNKGAPVIFDSYEFIDVQDQGYLRN